MASAFGQVGTFFIHVREELKQVSWPTREELLGSALVVFVGVALLATFIGICNLLLSRFAKLLLQ